MAASSISDWVAAAEEESRASYDALNLSQTQFGSLDVNTGYRLDSPGNKTNDRDEDKSMTSAEVSLIQKLLRTGLYQNTKDKLEITRKDPSSPFFSIRTFEELNLRPDLLKGIYAMGFNSPSRIQEVALPFLLSVPPQNLIAQSQSGTGKTAAFLLAVLSSIDPKQHYPQALCIAPTYELALQTGEVAKMMGKFCPEISLTFAVRQSQVVYGAPVTEHIIIGTPGTVISWAFRMKTFDITKLRVFVLDEADVMIGTHGFRDYCIRINRKLDPSCQRLLFSATYEQDVMAFADEMIPNATIINLKIQDQNLENIKQCYIKCPSREAKYNAIANIYAAITVGGALVFCQTKTTAAWLASKLRQDGHSVALLSGDLELSQRVDVLRRFKESKEKIIVTTNVMARGIDVEAVSLVVNYDMPVDCNYHPDCETYLHRIGRTGRFGKLGIAVNLIEDERSQIIMDYIKNHYKANIIALDSDNVEELEALERY